MNRRLVKSSLKMLCQKYQSENGRSLAYLAKYKFNYSIFVNLSGNRPWNRDIMEDGDLLGWIVDELDSLGYVSKRAQFFYLTEKGFKVGTNNIFQKLMGWLNENPGLAIAISFVSLVVSVVALYLSAHRS